MTLAQLAVLLTAIDARLDRIERAQRAALPSDPDDLRRLIATARKRLYRMGASTHEPELEAPAPFRAPE